MRKWKRRTIRLKKVKPSDVIASLPMQQQLETDPFIEMLGGSIFNKTVFDYKIFDKCRYLSGLNI